MVFNLFNKFGSIDSKPEFAQKINNNVYLDTQDLILRHVEMIYADLKEDLKNGSRGIPSRPLSMEFHDPSRADPSQHDPHVQSSIHTTHQPPYTQPQAQTQHPYLRAQTGHPYSAHYDTQPERVHSQGGYHQDDSDGQNPAEREGHPGHIGCSLEAPDTTTTLPPSGGHPNAVQEASPQEERGYGQSAAPNNATRQASEHTTLPFVPLRPRTNADPHWVKDSPSDLPSTPCPRQDDSRSRSQTNNRERRTSEPFRYNGNIGHPTPDNPNQENPGNEALKEVTNKILHWIEACQKRLQCLPGATIAKFQRALNEIPPEIHLGERYIPQLEKLAKRLERFYWRIMRHDDFQYIRSACDGAQERVEAWSRKLRSHRETPSERQVGDLNIYHDRWPSNFAVNERAQREAVTLVLQVS